MNDQVVTIGKRGVKVPVVALLEAIPKAVAAAQAKAADDRAPDSPGGATVTPGEVLEDVGAFLKALGEAALPAVLQANGLG